MEISSSYLCYADVKLTSPGNIRLLTIDSPSNSKVISCRLTVVDLFNTIPEYQGLSYTWGSAKRPPPGENEKAHQQHTVLCNGYPISVTANLFDFLAKASVLIPKKYLWIDSICINQRNPVEKAGQVQLMSMIYSSAISVIVWLGEQDEHTQKAFELLKGLGECNSNVLTSITPKVVENKGFYISPEVCADFTYWTSLWELFQRRYFTRAWTIQEVMFAKSIQVYCGEFTINWDPLARVSQHLVTSAWTRWFAWNRNNLDTPYRAYHGFPNLLLANQTDKIIQKGNEPLQFLYFLIRSRRFDATEDRDKVYAILSLCQEYTSQKPRYHPFYGAATAANTFKSTAIQLLQDLDDLLVLTCVEGRKYQKHQLPSWVPDWSMTQVPGLGVTGYKRFEAAGKIPRTLLIHEARSTLTVSGFELDTIDHIGESKNEILHSNDFPRLISLYEIMPQTYFNGQTRLETIWRSLLTDTSGLSRELGAPDSFASAFAAWMRPKLSQTTPTPLLLTEILEKYPHSSDTSSSEEYETTFSHAPLLRPFQSTNHQYFGIGSDSLVPGDGIWIVAGCRVPLILRSAGNEAFEIVGGAYVHGMMNGQALALNRNFTNITII